LPAIRWSRIWIRSAHLVEISKFVYSAPYARLAGLFIKIELISIEKRHYDGITRMRMKLLSAHGWLIMQVVVISPWRVRFVVIYFIILVAAAGTGHNEWFDGYRLHCITWIYLSYDFENEKL
jgi:hypothetical protein